ncbi:MAG TPA: hypothetical protein VFU43_30210 [Streptosporangiaceae bacterium]|nr:hypothetical protein [Streptosporangiaceae bacterium]
MSTHSPFVGSHPFSTADKTIFYGRADESTALSGLWRDRPLIVLHGPAGVGKTSLLRAGVLPMLGPASDVEVLPIGRPALRADLPLAALDLNPFTFALLSSWYPDEPPARISGSSIHDLVRRKCRTTPRGDPIPVLAAIDQIDLLFPTAGRRDRHRRRFVEELIEATATTRHGLGGVHLLIAVRTENLDALLGLFVQAGLPTDSVVEFPLNAFDPDAACQAVRGPLDGIDHPLATSARQLVEELAAGDAAVDPALLQIVCGRLWDAVPSGSRDAIELLPTVVDHVLGDHCRQALATVAREHGRLPHVLSTWFRDLFARGHATGIVEGRVTTHDLPNSVMRALEDMRLLEADQCSGERRYRLRQARLRPAIRRLDASAGDAPRPVRPRLAAAEAAFTAGELELARHRAKAVAADPTASARQRAAAECLLGTIAYDEGRPRLATKHYEAAAGAYGALGDTAHVGMLFAAVGRLRIGDGTPEAVNSLLAALTRLPGDPFVKTALAHALWYAGRTQAAIAVLDDALSQDGGTPEALRLRGELLADLDEAEPALRDLDRVNYGDRISSLAAWALAKKTYEGVGPPETEERRLVNDAADSGPVLLRVARVLRLEGDADTAADLAERAVKARRPPLPRHLRKEAERLMVERLR